MKMQKLKIFLYIFFSLIIGGASIFVALAAISYFSANNSGFELKDGEFYSNGNGNAGTINMQNSGREGVDLKGTIKLQSVGAAEFQDARILPPSENVTRMCWKISGKLFSKNAGDIELTDNKGAHVRYNPLTKQLEGYGYNRNLGKVWFGMDEYCTQNDDKITNNVLEDIKTDDKLAGSGASFIGKVKVIGPQAGNNTFSDVIYDMIKGVEATNYNTLLQEVRHNAFLLSRNISAEQQNVNFDTSIAVGNILFYINTSKENKTVDISSWKDGIRSIVIIGGDALISQNINKNNAYPLAIIALANNEHNIGGDIYVKQNVTNINALLFAEKSLLSGESQKAANRLYNDTADEVANLPKNQLHIFGTVVSRNTIGGASNDIENMLCPYNVNCIAATAPIYDFNYFRAFDVKNIDTGGANRAYDYNGVKLDEYSMIIEYDARVLNNPPPGFEVVR